MIASNLFRPGLWLALLLLGLGAGMPANASDGKDRNVLLLAVCSPGEPGDARLKVADDDCLRAYQAMDTFLDLKWKRLLTTLDQPTSDGLSKAQITLPAQLRDATASNLDAAVSELQELLRNISRRELKRSVLILYLASHHAPDGQLVMDDRAIRTLDLFNRLASLRLSQVVVVLDTCHGTSLVKDFRAQSPGGSDGLVFLAANDYIDEGDGAGAFAVPLEKQLSLLTASAATSRDKPTLHDLMAGVAASAAAAVPGGVYATHSELNDWSALPLRESAVGYFSISSDDDVWVHVRRAGASVWMFNGQTEDQELDLALPPGTYDFVFADYNGPNGNLQCRAIPNVGTRAQQRLPIDVSQAVDVSCEGYPKQVRGHGPPPSHEPISQAAGADEDRVAPGPAVALVRAEPPGHDASLASYPFMPPPLAPERLGSWRTATRVGDTYAFGDAWGRDVEGSALPGLPSGLGIDGTVTWLGPRWRRWRALLGLRGALTRTVVDQGKEQSPDGEVYNGLAAGPVAGAGWWGSRFHLALHQSLALAPSWMALPSGEAAPGTYRIHPFGWGATFSVRASWSLPNGIRLGPGVAVDLRTTRDVQANARQSAVVGANGDTLEAMSWLGPPRAYLRLQVGFGITSRPR